VSFSLDTSGGKAGSLGRNCSVGALVLVAGWFAVIATTLAVVANYSNTPGREGTAPPDWPTQSRVTLDAHRPTLLMFAHPHCPCTRASLGELDSLLARCPGQLSVHVLFIRPAGAAKDWVQTDLWRRAAALPGVAVQRDDGCVEAQRFHTKTSGNVLLYNPQGRLLFQGGITLSRGHSGDNAGRSALIGLVRHEVARPIQTPVFGCSLFENQCQEGSTECRK
jgi:hypothetical protein